MHISDSKYKLGYKINIGLDKNDVKFIGEIKDIRYYNGWEYKVFYDIMYQEIWYNEIEFKKGFLDRW